MSRATEQAGRGHAIEAWRFRSTLTLLRTGVAFSLLGLVGGATLAGFASSEADRQLAIAYTSAQATQHLAPAVLIGIQPPAPPPAILRDDAPERIAATRLFWRMGLTGGVLAILLGGGLTALLRRHWIKAAQSAALDQVLRGNRVATADELTRLVMKTRPPEPLLRIGGVPIPPDDETRHFLDIGKSGTGKTSVLHNHVGQIGARGGHALIFDPDGSYVERFYRPERGDVILNPWDQRSHRWDMLADVGSLEDAHRIAAILLPKPATAGDSGFWFDQARTLLAHILDHQARIGTTSLADLSTALNSTTADDLRAIVAGTPAARIFEAGGERATASMLFIMTMAARTVATLATISQDAPAFSFDRFYAGLAEHDGPKPMIFLAAPRRNREAGAPVIAAWIDAAASAILQRDPGDAPKAWLFLDELASLPTVQSLLTLLPEGRKHRACVVIAFQSIAQLRQAYGDEGAEIISGQTATQLILHPSRTQVARAGQRADQPRHRRGLPALVGLSHRQGADRAAQGHGRHRARVRSCPWDAANIAAQHAAHRHPAIGRRSHRGPRRLAQHGRPVMVAKPTKLTDAAAAHSHYQADDYWSREAAGQWKGRAACDLGLSGEVDPDQFMTLLKGKLPDGTQLGTTRKGVREHTPGFDLTMSAPKSVSVVGLVAGDRRVIDAHARAVDVALGYDERHIGVTRIRTGETVERVATEKLAVAQFLHVTARETENGTPAPQIHSHNVILNMTPDDAGNWRSLDARDLYRLQKYIGAVYHMELAAELRQLGYSVTVAPDTIFEIDGVPQDVQRLFSERSAQIEAALAARGQTRASGSAAEKSVIALETRAPKRSVDHATLVATWRAQADELGFDEATRRAMVTAAEARALARPNLGTIQRMAEADKAVAFAMAKLSEREAVFTAADLEREAARKPAGAANHADVIAAIARAERRQALMVRAALRMAQGIVGYTTREAVATERNLLAMEVEGRDAGKAIVGQVRAAAAIAAAERRSAHPWTRGQREATRQLLRSTSTITGLHGHAGTAKTTTVLKTIADTARTQKMPVRALAPTGNAADVLGRAIGVESETLARMLAGESEPCESGAEVWIVDEASMGAARDVERLFIRAREVGARLILVGDTQQLGSVGAGRAFGQLREAGMETAILDEILRQSNQHTREAVETILAGDAGAAFDALDAGGRRDRRA